MHTSPTQGDDKLAEEVKETGKKRSHEATEEGVEEAKEDVASEEDKKN